jgi:hypothetical protein
MENGEKQEIYLPQFVADILTHHGGLVENGEQGLLEFVLPPAMAATLKIAEHGRLNFTYADIAGEAIDASYDSDLFTNIAHFFQEKGKWATATFPPYEPGTEKIVKTLRERLSLTNAVVSVGNIESGDIFYLLVYFKYAAFSDERQEGIVGVLLQEKSLSTAEIQGNGQEILEKLSQGEVIPPCTGDDMGRDISIACKVAEGMVQQRTEDLVKSLERRLNRDVKRVCEYYETLKQEARKSLEKKAIAESKRGSLTENLEQQIGDKLHAIGSEQEWKIRDLISQYALQVEIQPLAAVRIKTSSLIFHMAIKRRLSTRKFALSYNPLLHQLDRLPCEACFCPDGNSYYVCDEQLHIVCSNCLARCPHCQKQFCRACHPSGCSKCGK